MITPEIKTQVMNLNNSPEPQEFVTNVIKLQLQNLENKLHYSKNEEILHEKLHFLCSVTR